MIAVDPSIRLAIPSPPAENPDRIYRNRKLMNTRTQPRLIENPREAYQAVRAAQSAGQRVGVVMTMGALHAGHLRLVEQCRKECDTTFVTIFVNPTQFLPGEDFDRYPRHLARDVELLASLQTDCIFAPSTHQMFPPGSSTEIRAPEIARALEGEHRPGHFDGVCTIVCKLLHVLPVERAYFGEKDYQQYRVIQHMTAELDLPVTIVPCPIVRDEDGLALSSRNQYLDGGERKRALSLSEGLQKAAEQVALGEQDASRIIEQIRQTLNNAGIHDIDYVTVADPEHLTPMDAIDRPARALIAAHVGKTRLIDNWLLVPPTEPMD